MNNDLISRSALRARYQEILDRGDMFCEYDIIGMVDNAPAVDVMPYAIVKFDKDELDRIVDERIIEPIKNGELVIQTEERPQEWIPCSERLPEEKLFNPSGSDFVFDFEEVLCTTIWGDVRAYKFGKPIGHDKPHFWFGAKIMDEYVIAWQYKPEPYKKGGAE